MDARDSTSNRDVSSSGGSGTTTGGGGGEEDPILSVTAALAKDAWLHFNSRRFNECLEVLYQLKQKKEDDPKVLHNIAIAEYCRDGYPDPKKLLEVLNNIERKSKELAHTSGEQVETVNNLGNKVISGSKGSGATTLQASATNSTSVVYMDEFDPTVARLNIAIIWYHLHEYSKALSVLEPLYHNIEPIEERTALHVCLLLLDVALACQDASKSADVLLYLEKAFGFGCVGQSENGNTAQQQSASLVAKSSYVPSSSPGMDANSDLASSENALEKSLSRTLSLSDETLEYESMFSLDISGQDLARPAGLSFSTDLSRNPIDRSFSPSEMKLKLHLYKVQFLLLTRNLKQAKREVKLAINIARVRDSPMALLLKSQLEYARSNHRKAIKLLMAASNRTEMGISSMFNNLGCIYYQLGKYHTASVLFSKALSSSSSLQKDKPWKLLTFLQDKSLLIVYNCGVQHLACGKPLLAARCFEKASLVFYNRPLLWLRLAECCLVALERGLLKASRVLSDKSDVTVHVFGKGKWRHLAVESGISSNGYVDSFEKEDMFLGSDSQLKLSVPLARQCLLNALHLLDYSGLNHLKPGLPSNLSLDENEMSEAGSMKNSNHKNLTGFDSKTSTVGLGQVNANGDAKEQKGGTSQEIMQNSISFHEDIRRRENQMLKQALLANLAYVELELENPEKALSTARSLLELPVCSRIYIFLGHVYAAEALCLLNKPKEAAEHLSIYLSGGNNVELPFSQEDFEQWRVEKAFDYEEMNGGSVATKNSSPEESQGIVFLNPEEARGTLYTNFAVLCAAQGDLERAHHFVTQALSLVPNHPQATLTAVYVDLMLCNTQAAIGKLKQCSRVRFLPSGVHLSKC
ncbi:PREDICTED: CCR4-NOT transcription complex subunit 10-like [Populus euphratica]|uniref:CCR4-NOT transcription complex subunit 10-like n=1 Tax=Populus euphratica TaxID=75702 RepID=A0AAJ6XIG3_POPEU|nr:PREDICTED: CCR4-NOT transcription complex subunit 10-like [Populus euphratica]